jgi:hypothetical protein
LLRLAKRLGHPTQRLARWSLAMAEAAVGLRKASPLVVGAGQAATQALAGQAPRTFLLAETQDLAAVEGQVVVRDRVQAAAVLDYWAKDQMARREFSVA